MSKSRGSAPESNLQSVEKNHSETATQVRPPVTSTSVKKGSQTDFEDVEDGSSSSEVLALKSKIDAVQRA